MGWVAKCIPAYFALLALGAWLGHEASARIQRCPQLNTDNMLQCASLAVRPVGQSTGGSYWWAQSQPFLAYYALHWRDAGLTPTIVCVVPVCTAALPVAGDSQSLAML